MIGIEREEVLGGLWPNAKSNQIYSLYVSSAGPLQRFTPNLTHGDGSQRTIEEWTDNKINMSSRVRAIHCHGNMPSGQHLSSCLRAQQCQRTQTQRDHTQTQPNAIRNDRADVANRRPLMLVWLSW